MRASVAWRIGYLVAAAIAIAAAILVARSASAAPLECATADFVVTRVEIEALALGVEPLHLVEAGEVRRYLEVINEDPPESGPADQLVVLPHAEIGVAGVWLIQGGMNCETYEVPIALHRRALAAARGREA